MCFFQLRVEYEFAHFFCFKNWQKNVRIAHLEIYMYMIVHLKCLCTRVVPVNRRLLSEQETVHGKIFGF